MANARTLTRAQLRELASELERERARLEARLVNESSEDGSVIDGASERIDAEVRSGLGVTTESRTRMRYDAVVAAQARLEDGTYGICQSCGVEIPFGRLLVMPETPLCMACGPRI